MHRDVGTTRAPRVLIADSDARLRQLLFNALLAVDVFSDCVGTVPDALAKLSEEAYAVVVLDIVLPGGNPEEVVARIAELPRAERPVVLVMAVNALSARSLDVEIVQIVLRKPIAVQQTVELIHSCVQGASTRSALAENGDHLTS